MRNFHCRHPGGMVGMSPEKPFLLHQYAGTRWCQWGIPLCTAGLSREWSLIMTFNLHPVSLSVVVSLCVQVSGRGWKLTPCSSSVWQPGHGFMAPDILSLPANRQAGKPIQPACFFAWQSPVALFRTLYFTSIG